MSTAAPAAIVALTASLALGGAAAAQTVGPPAKHNNNTYGSPLDTLKSSRLWTDTPEPKSFVRDSRPPAGTLDYTPLSGADPERAKPRDPANVAALQAELERAGARLGAKAGHRRSRRDGARSGGRSSDRSGDRGGDGGGRSVAGTPAPTAAAPE